MQQVTQKAPLYDATQWDGQPSAAAEILEMFGPPNDPQAPQIEDTTLMVSNAFTTFPVEMGSWSVRGPYWETAEGLQPNIVSDAVYQARYEVPVTP
jgi:hypothetical protein